MAWANIHNDDQPILTVTLPATSEYAGEHKIPAKKIVPKIPLQKTNLVKDNQGDAYARYQDLDNQESRSIVITFEALDFDYLHILKDTTLHGTTLYCTQVETSRTGTTCDAFLSNPAVDGTIEIASGSSFDVTFEGDVQLTRAGTLS